MDWRKKNKHLFSSTQHKHKWTYKRKLRSGTGGGEKWSQNRSINNQQGDKLQCLNLNPGRHNGHDEEEWGKECKSRDSVCVCVCHSRNSLCLCVCVFTLMTHKARCIQEKRKGGGNFCHIRCRPFKCIRMTFETLQWFEAWNGQFPPLLSVKTTTEFRTFLRRTKIENFNHCFFFYCSSTKLKRYRAPIFFLIWWMIYQGVSMTVWEGGGSIPGSGRSETYHSLRQMAPLLFSNSQKLPECPRRHLENTSPRS